MSIGNTPNLTPSTTDTQKTQQTNQSQQTTAKIGESLSKIVSQKQKWELGLPQGFESGQRIEKRLNKILSKGSHPSQTDKVSSLLGHLDPEIKQRITQHGFPTYDRNWKRYGNSFGDILHFKSNGEDYKNSGGESKDGIAARVQVRTAMMLGILLQVPLSDLNTLRTELCKGTDEDRAAAIKRLASKVRDNFQRVDDYSKLPDLLKNYSAPPPKLYRQPLMQNYGPRRRLSLSTARSYEASRDWKMHPTQFTDPKHHDPHKYRLQVHMFANLHKVGKYVIDEKSGRIKNNWPDNARVISTSVISQDVGTQFGVIGFSLHVNPKRVIASHETDFQSKLGIGPKVSFYDEATKMRENEPFRLLSVEELLNGGTTGRWNEVLVQGGTKGTGDPEPQGTVQINGVVVYDQTSNEAREFAKKIAEANDLPLLKLGDQTRMRNYRR